MLRREVAVLNRLECSSMLRCCYQGSQPEILASQVAFYEYQCGHSFVILHTARQAPCQHQNGVGCSNRYNTSFQQQNFLLLVTKNFPRPPGSFTSAVDVSSSLWLCGICSKKIDVPFFWTGRSSAATKSALRWVEPQARNKNLFHHWTA